MNQNDLLQYSYHTKLLDNKTLYGDFLQSNFPGLKLNGNIPFYFMLITLPINLAKS